MAVLRRPVPRFFVWTTLLVAVAVATAAAGLSWWLIAVIELAAWTLVTLAERMLWRRGVAASATHEPAPAVDEQTAANVLAVAPQMTPVALPPAPRRVMRTLSRPASPPARRTQVEWNVWTLEKLARDHPEKEELEFLSVSLRDFATADGKLPADFDPLVRESFGELLPG